MKSAGIIAILISLFTSLPSWATDYTGTDCNHVEMRAFLIEEYNDALESSNAIDSYDQITEKAGKDHLVCNGIFEFGDGERLRVRYERKLNSLGQEIYTFTPIEEL